MLNSPFLIWCKLWVLNDSCAKATDKQPHPEYRLQVAAVSQLFFTSAWTLFLGPRRKVLCGKQV